MTEARTVDETPEEQAIRRARAVREIFLRVAAIDTELEPFIAQLAEIRGRMRALEQERSALADGLRDVARLPAHVSRIQALDL
jgi:hypothetical protein